MNFSRFNNTILCGEDLIVYNSLNGSIIKIPQNLYCTTNPNLVSAGFVVDRDDDIHSYAYFFNNAIFKTDELNVVIATSLDCNLSCPYCFEKNARSNNSITQEVIRSLAKFIIHKKHLPVHITWFGGEPMLRHKAISNLSDILLQEEGLQFESNLITNGTIMPSQFLNKIDLYNIKTIQITLDGIKDVHDSKRYFKSGNGTFYTITSNIRRILEQTHADVIIKINVDRNNLNEFHNLQEYIKNSFNDYRQSNRILLTSNYIRNKTNFEGSENCMTCSEYFDFLRANGAPYKMPDIKGPCPLRKQGYYVISPDGNIYKCMEHLGITELALGNITDFKMSLPKRGRFSFSKNPLTDKICAQCSILPICGGGCPNERSLCEDNQRPCPAEKYKLSEIILNLYEKCL